ncbi:DUF4282 domain-containing protein [Corynebacterium lubricantis]|uniref:DUF4282 domain-containing protein n=1 Tax=Corynebacterium lubricantis TaxID=541095 RepID=UPI0003641836|nr:DUF4282 domain-containing protein [Corynebacterium lubricantis]
MTSPQDPSNNERPGQDPSSGAGAGSGSGQPGPSGAGQPGSGYNPSGYGYNPHESYGNYQQQGYPQYPAGGNAPHQAQQSSSKGFFNALFDFSFTNFITIRFAKFIYIFIIAILAVYWGFMLLVSLSAFSEGFGLGLLALLGTLIVGGLLFLFGVIMARLTLEFYVSNVRTAENTGKMAEK